MANNALAMQDQEMMRDALSSEKQMTGLYNAFANECATTAIRDEMLNLLHDEHAIQADLFMEMQKRGWYPTPAAKADKINQAKQKATQEDPANAQQ